MKTLQEENAELKAFISVTLHKDGFTFDSDSVKAMRLINPIPWENTASQFREPSSPTVVSDDQAIELIRSCEPGTKITITSPTCSDLETKEQDEIPLDIWLDFGKDNLAMSLAAASNKIDDVVDHVRKEMSKKYSLTRRPDNSPTVKESETGEQEEIDKVFDWAKCGIYHNHAYNEEKLQQSLDILDRVMKSSTRKPLDR